MANSEIIGQEDSFFYVWLSQLSVVVFHYSYTTSSWLLPRQNLASTAFSAAPIHDTASNTEKDRAANAPNVGPPQGLADLIGLDVSERGPIIGE